MPDHPSPEFLAEAAYFIRVTQIFFCSMYALVLWDWLVCLRREYRLVWSQRFTIPTFLYFGCRYWVIIIMPIILWINSNESHTVAACAALYNVPPLIAMWNQIFAEAVLLLRTHAFLGQKRWVVVSLSISLGVVAVYQLYVALREMAPLPFVTAPFDTGPCLPTVRFKGSAHVMGWFLAPLAFDTIVTVMTIYRAFQIRKRGGSGSPILQTFLREGIFYFILISIVNLINGIFNVQTNVAISALIVPLSLVFPDILACRMVLDLREQGLSSKPNTTHSSSNNNNHGPILPRWSARPVAVPETPAVPANILTTRIERSNFNDDKRVTHIELEQVRSPDSNYKYPSL